MSNAYHEGYLAAHRVVRAALNRSSTSASLIEAVALFNPYPRGSRANAVYIKGVQDYMRDGGGSIPRPLRRPDDRRRSA